MQNRLGIIDALEAARKAQGLTQAELATRSGTTRVTVGRIENGFDPKLSTLYELARALGLELTLVPKSLAGEVQAFLRSGGRSLGQPVGASAPPSVVDLAGRTIAQALATGELSVTKALSPTRASNTLKPLDVSTRVTWGKQQETPPQQANEAPHTGAKFSRETDPAGGRGPGVSPDAARALGLDQERK